MPELLFLAFSYFVEAIVVYMYAKTIYEFKKNKFFTIFLVFIIYLVVMIIYKYLVNNDISNTIFTIVANISIVYFLFKSTLKSSIFHGVMLSIIFMISEFLSAYMIAFFLNVSSQAVIEEHFEVGAIISRILYFTLTQIASKISFKEKPSKSLGRWYLLSLLPISSVFVLLVIRMLSSDTNLNKFQSITSIISIAFLFLVNIIVYAIYEHAEKNSQKIIELEIVNQKNNIDLQYLSLLEKKNEQMQIMAHDYKNHILNIESISDSPDVKKYINDMLGEISEYSKAGKTKNKLLDVILSKYIDICKDKNINFEIDIISENLAKIKNGADISSIFNNLLDNAVEAAEKSKEKYIKIQIANSINSYHRITVLNSCDFEPYSKSEKLITTKSNKEIHGFGTKSIKRIVDKYSGELQWYYDKTKKEFKITILIPIEKK